MQQVDWHVLIKLNGVSASYLKNKNDRALRNKVASILARLQYVDMKNLDVKVLKELIK